MLHASALVKMDILALTGNRTEQETHNCAASAVEWISLLDSQMMVNAICVVMGGFPVDGSNFVRICFHSSAHLWAEAKTEPVRKRDQAPGRFDGRSRVGASADDSNPV